MDKIEEVATPTTLPPNHDTFEVKYPSGTSYSANARPFITQDEYNSSQLVNTCQRRHGSITQDYMLAMMEQAGKMPLQFLCDMASTILDKETGNLPEILSLDETSKV
jgi:hypothetical protein